jgi:hypothetical protein
MYIDKFTPQLTDEDKNLIGLAEAYLGNEMFDFEYVEAKKYAEHKLFDWIIPREGDSNGERRKPYYLAKLIEETVRSNRFSDYCAYKSRENKQRAAMLA